MKRATKALDESGTSWNKETEVTDEDLLNIGILILIFLSAIYNLVYLLVPLAIYCMGMLIFKKIITIKKGSLP